MQVTKTSDGHCFSPLHLPWHLGTYSGRHSLFHSLALTMLLPQCLATPTYAQHAASCEPLITSTKRK
jgi:hypothetical protein